MIIALAVPAGAAFVTIDDTQSIQAAIDNLVASPDPTDTLILNPGTYPQHDIVIKKNIVIRANTSYGHDATDTIIDAMRAGRIFDNNAGHALTADNLTLQNATMMDVDFGGAILNDNGGTLTVTSSRFFNCSANVGGAIFNNHGGTVTITGSAFTDCSSWFGGAITNYWESPGTVTITSSEFLRCTVSPDPYDYEAKGGAIGNMGTLAVTSSTFTDCSAQAATYLSAGGAIDNYQGTATITSSVFTNCHSGAATYHYWGGAIQNVGGTLTVTSSEFNGCSAPGGGAIHVTGGSAAIAGSTFTGCSAEEGGAIYSEAPLTITGSTFSGCTATGRGGAIFSNGPATITTSTFSGCSAIFSGGAIYISTGTATITGSTFSGCPAVFGGAIYIFSGTLNLTSSEFTNCPAGYLGGALYNYQGTATITTSTFTGCTADLESPGSTGSGGAIYTTGTTTITSTTFSGCSAASGGGAITNGGALTMLFSRIVDCGSIEAYGAGGSADAENNWWGTNAAPPVSGSIDADPWLVLGITADPASIDTAGISAIRTNLTFNSDNLVPGGGYVPDAITNTYAMVSGSGSVSPLTDWTVNGAAQTTFTPVYGETANISGTVDDQTVYIELPVAQGAPTVTGITPDTGVNSTGIAITNLAGSAFTIYGTTVVRLMRAGHTNITATGVTVVSPIRITCTLPIAGAEAGAWDVVVTNPDGREAVLPGGFTVTAYALPTPPLPTMDPRDNDDDWPQTGSPSSSSTSSESAPLMTVTVNIGGDSKAFRTTVTGTKLAGLVVTGAVQTGPAANVTALPGAVFQYFTLAPAGYDSITKAVINFTVPQSWLDENRIGGENIVLYRLTASGWEALPTTFLYTKDGTAYFSAQSGGFSLFAIAGTQTAATPVATVNTPASVSTQAQPQAPAAGAKAPVTTQTTTPPAPAPEPAGTSPVPVVPVLLGLCCVGLIGGGWYARRWWLHRQNPALFEEY